MAYFQRATKRAGPSSGANFKWTHYPLAGQNGQPPPTGQGASAQVGVSYTYDAPLVVMSTTLPGGEQQVFYSASLSITGGSAPYTWALTNNSSLPAGLTLNSTSGAITGTPTGAPGSTQFSVVVSDLYQISLPVALSISIAGPPAVTTTNLPGGETYGAYAALLQASGGVQPFSWQIASGALPSGLTMNSSGAISGTPSSASPPTSNFSVTVTDSNHVTSAPVPLSIQVIAGPSVTTTSLPPGEVTAAYPTTTLQANGGVAQLNWKVAGGSLPSGLTMNASGAISGKPSAPTASPTPSFTVTVTDANNVTSAPATLSIAVVTGPSITNTSLPNGVVQVSYSAQLTATGGSTNYTQWSITQGSLPAGLTLNQSTGSISGSPSASGPSSFSVTVMDSAGVTSSAQSLTITVTSGVTITNTTLNSGEYGIAYSQQLNAAGGQSPYSSWTVSTGTLPGGLSLGASSGMITGNPNGPAGTANFSVTVKDSAGHISPAQSLSITMVSAVTITTTALPGAQQNASYSETLAESGGVSPFTWSIASGVLPTGLSLNSNTGIISGNATVAGSANITLRVTDGLGGTYSRAFTLSVGGGCTYTVNPTSVYLDATSQSSSLSVTAGSGCSWSASSASGFITITAGATGSSNGTVQFTVGANTTGADLTGSLTVAGQPVAVTQRQTATVFTDVPPSAYYFDFVNVMYQKGITEGCASIPLQYCPNESITREEMAVFLVDAIEGNSNFTYTMTPYFTDVPASSIYFKFVQKLKDLGITSGCEQTLFCPDDAVTRAEMAVFIIAGRYGAIPVTSGPVMAPTTPYFTDVASSSPYFPFIQKMAQTGITGGCGGGEFCPNEPLPRGEMAVFVVTGLLNELFAPTYPVISSAIPDQVAPGQTITVTLTGKNTQFAQGTTQVITPPFITATNIQVTSETVLRVQLAASGPCSNLSLLPTAMPPCAPSGPVSLVVLTGAQEADLPNQFVVQ